MPVHKLFVKCLQMLLCVPKHKFIYNVNEFVLSFFFLGIFLIQSFFTEGFPHFYLLTPRPCTGLSISIPRFLF